jgi:hypothetical protein
VTVGRQGFLAEPGAGDRKPWRWSVTKRGLPARRRGRRACSPPSHSSAPAHSRSRTRCRLAAGHPQGDEHARRQLRAARNLESDRQAFARPVARQTEGTRTANMVACAAKLGSGTSRIESKVSGRLALDLPGQGGEHVHRRRAEQQGARSTSGPTHSSACHSKRRTTAAWRTCSPWEGRTRKRGEHAEHVHRLRERELGGPATMLVGPRGRGLKLQGSGAELGPLEVASSNGGRCLRLVDRVATPVAVGAEADRLTAVAAPCGAHVGAGGGKGGTEAEYQSRGRG